MERKIVFTKSLIVVRAANDQNRNRDEKVNDSKAVNNENFIFFRAHSGRIFSQRDNQM
jgi:hypothetical protein